MNVKQTVFVVDDEPSVAKAVSRLLRAKGYTIETFTSAQEFMERYEPGVRGCLVLDLSMPGMTGAELQRALTVRESSLPILFLSGDDEIPNNVRAKMINEGAVDILTKPVDSSALFKCVDEALARDLKS